MNFDTPTPVLDVDLAFGGNLDVLMPPMEDIPKEFHKRGTMWHRMQMDWFYQGIDHTRLIPKPGIDKIAALRHLKAIQMSFGPKHEHKEAAIAYLASLWFEPTSTWERLKK